MKNRGATLLEIIIAMLVIGMVASGILTAFVFSRRMTHRSGSELQGASFVQQTSEALRGAIAGNLANGLSLTPGVYSSPGMQNAPAGSTAVNGLGLPAGFQRFLLAALGDASLPAGINNHGDGRLVIVEEAPRDLNGDGDFDDPGELSPAAADLDGDGLAGVDFNNDGVTDLRRVKVRLQWHTPNVQ